MLCWHTVSWEAASPGAAKPAPSERGVAVTWAGTWLRGAGPVCCSLLGNPATALSSAGRGPGKRCLRVPLLLLRSLLFASHSAGKCGWGIPSFPLTSSFHVTGQQFCLHDRQLEVQLEPCLPCGVPLLRGAWRPWDRGEHGRSGAVQEGIEPPAQLLHVEETFKALRSFFLCQCADVCVCFFF